MKEFEFGPLNPSILQAYTASISDYISLYDNKNGFNPFKMVEGKILPFITEKMTVLAIVRGHVEMEINGQKVGLNPLSYTYIMPKSKVRIISYTLDLQYFMYMFYDMFLQDLHYDLGLGYNKSVLSFAFLTHQLSQEDFDYRLNIYRQIKDEILHRGSIHRKLAVRSWGNVILINDFQFFDYFVNSNKKNISRQSIQFRNFIELLNEYTIREREVQFYAKKLGITPKYLSALCIAYSGKNASTWIDEYVIVRAKELLREQRYSVREVGEILNFPSQSFFGRYFKRNMGISPKVFMETSV
jgi:AraC-like DNA-binding protein